MTKENIPIQIFNWGPCVIKCKIKPEYGKMLLDEAKLNKADFRPRLAGQIEKETGYGDVSKKKIIPILAQYLGVYDQAYQSWTQKPYDKQPEYVMSSLWINYQKANEFNPPHDHDGKLSFVIYLKIPDELKKENKEAVKILKKKVKNANLFLDLRDKEYYTKPSEKKRHKRNLAKIRNKYKNQKEQKQH